VGNLALGHQNSCTIDAGEWCSEAILWTEWVHVGIARAIQDSEILVIDAKHFVKATQAHYKVVPGTIEYAQGFVKRLNEWAEEGIYSDYIPKSTQMDFLRELANQSFNHDGNPPARGQTVVTRLSKRLSASMFRGIRTSGIHANKCDSSELKVDRLESSDSKVDRLESSDSKVDRLESSDSKVDRLELSDSKVDRLESSDSKVDRPGSHVDRHSSVPL